MSTFKATIEVIDTVSPHSNADRLDILTVKGMNFRFVSAKGRFKQGDAVVYIPLDSIVPQEVLAKMGLVGKLTGKDRNRVKTIVLRGEISQGLVDSPENLGVKGNIGDDVTDILGIVKYEPPMKPCKNANLLPLPAGLTTYDIEGCDRFSHILETLYENPVFITEKAEGSNFSVTVDAAGHIWVNQRNYTIQEKDGVTHDFWAEARKKVIPFAQKLLIDKKVRSVTIYGEFIGFGYNGNIYKMNNHKILVFDILLSDSHKTYMNSDEFISVCKANDIETVPVLAYNVLLKDWLNGKTIKDASHGKSLIGDTLREGIVVKPMVESRHSEIGRLFLKQRDPIYLTGADC